MYYLEYYLKLFAFVISLGDLLCFILSYLITPLLFMFLIEEIIVKIEAIKII